MIKIVTHKRKGCFYCGKTVYAGTGNYVKPFKLFDNKKLVHIKCNILKKAFKKKDLIKKIKYKKNKYKKNFVETELWNELIKDGYEQHKENINLSIKLVMSAAAIFTCLVFFINAMEKKK